MSPRALEVALVTLSLGAISVDEQCWNARETTERDSVGQVGPPGPSFVLEAPGAGC